MVVLGVNHPREEFFLLLRTSLSNLSNPAFQLFSGCSLMVVNRPSWMVVNRPLIIRSTLLHDEAFFSLIFLLFPSYARNARGRSGARAHTRMYTRETIRLGREYDVRKPPGVALASVTSR